MSRIRKGFAALKQNKCGGMSLVIALCAVALLVSLSLMLTYSSSLPLARANAKLKRERCYQLASSFSRVLEEDILAYSYECESTDILAAAAEMNIPAEKIAALESETFYTFANRVLDGVYSDYDPNRPEQTSFYYVAVPKEEKYGRISVRLRKETAENASSSLYSGQLNNPDDPDEVLMILNQGFNSYVLYVDVTAYIDNQSYTYSTEYLRKDSYQVRYHWSGTLSGEHDVWAYNGKWYTDSNHNAEIVNQSNYSNTDVVTITYTYVTSKTTFKQYMLTNTQFEGGV